MDAQPVLRTLQQPDFRWPVLGDGLGGDFRWSEQDWNLLRTLARLRNQHSKSVLIRIFVSPDDKNSSKYIIKVDGRPVECRAGVASRSFCWQLYKKQHESLSKIHAQKKWHRKQKSRAWHHIIILWCKKNIF